MALLQLYFCKNSLKSVVFFKAQHGSASALLLQEQPEVRGVFFFKA